MPSFLIPVIDILLLAFLLLPSYGQELSGVKVLIDGTPLKGESTSFLEDGQAMVPLRSTFERLGATVEWNEQNRTVTSRYYDKTLQLETETSTARLNGQTLALERPVRIRDGKAFVPARLLTEAMGSIIHWDGENKTVLVSTPSTDWPTSTPEAQGMSSQTLNQMFQSIDAYKDNDIHSVLVLRHGHLVAEKYFNGYTADTPQPIWSVTKSMLSAVTGVALERGSLPSLDEKVLTYFPEITLQNQDPQKNSITLRHLLTMTSGFNWRETDPLTQVSAFVSPESTRYLLERPLTRRPGESFNYDSGNAHLLSAVLQRQTGKTTFAYARDVLFNPLNITNITWGADAQGITYGGYGIVMRPRDMAKFGQLYLQQGIWEGRRLLPASWIAESTQGYVGAEGRLTKYGYLWRIDPNGTYRADGGFGQRILVDPKHDLVVVFTSGNAIYDFSYYDQLYQNFIVKSLAL